MSHGVPVYCPVCPKTYSRIDHLQRHLASHAPGRPFVCAICRKAFKRRDVLRRHSIMCHAHAGGGIDYTCEPPKTRTTRTACDRCARLKRACDSMNPCSNCAAKKESCSYAWLRNNAFENDSDQGLGARGEACDAPSTSMPLSENSQFQDAMSENRPELQSLPDDRISQPHLLPDSLGLGPVELDSWWAGAEGFSQENDFTSLHPEPDFDQLMHRPVESFSFLARFTSNDESMSRAFEIDTEAVSNVLSESLLSEAVGDGFSNVAEPNCPAPHNNRHLPHERQIFSQTGSSRSAHAIPGANSSWSFQLPLDIFPAFEWLTPSSLENTSSQEGLGSNYVQGSHPFRQSPAHAESKYCHLAIKSHQIFTAIKTMSLKGGGVWAINEIGANDWSPFLERECVDFFRPENLHRFLEYFWKLWYPNCPTIHKPTFDATNAPHQLLATMVLIGSALSPHANDNSRGKLWFDVVEKIVFSDETAYDAEEGSCTPCHPDRLEARLRALQASYAVCLYQNWEGRGTARGRVRRQRFSMVISVARDLMRYANHIRLDRLTAGSFCWKQFVLREQLIRSIMYVFLLDTAFTIFNNLPPRMVLRETTNDLACPEPCFQALTATDCFTKIQQWTSHPFYKQGIPFCAAVRSLNREILHQGMKLYLSQCGVLNLWAIVSAFHTLLFNLDPGFGSDSQFKTLRIAMTNWRSVWNLRCESSFSDYYGTHDHWAHPCMTEPDNSWKRIGFYRNALEYWLLGRIKLEKMESSLQTDEPGDDFYGTENRSATHVPSILPKFDETSMDQINDLITSFQRQSMVD